MNNPVISIVYNSSRHVAQSRMRLIAEIQAAGYDVCVLSPEDEGTKSLLDHGVKHYPIEMSQYGMNPISEIRCALQIEKLLKQIKPVASLHYTVKPNIFGNFAARRAGVPVINNIAGAGQVFSGKSIVLRPLVVWLYRRALRYSYRVFFQNFDDMKMFVNKKVVEKEVAKRIPGSGVDLERFSVKPFPSGAIRFIFVGRMLKEKGVREFLEAAQRFLGKSDQSKIAEFHIVGEHFNHGSYIDFSILDQMARKNLVVYHGAVDPEEIDQLLASAHCLVLPSYYGEGVPRVLLEACAMGRPIITTDNVGCRDVIDDGANGFKVKPRDVNSLLTALENFCDLDSDEIMKMSIVARAKVEKEFDELIVLKEYLDAISEVSDEQEIDRGRSILSSGVCR